MPRRRTVFRPFIKYLAIRLTRAWARGEATPDPPKSKLVVTDLHFDGFRFRDFLLRKGDRQHSGFVGRLHVLGIHRIRHGEVYAQTTRNSAPSGGSLCSSRLSRISARPSPSGCRSRAGCRCPSAPLQERRPSRPTRSRSPGYLPPEPTAGFDAVFAQQAIDAVLEEPQASRKVLGIGKRCILYNWHIN